MLLTLTEGFEAQVVGLEKRLAALESAPKEAELKVEPAPEPSELASESTSEAKPKSSAKKKF
jgi:hypothetical protein